jgi:hypothetical protein
MRVCELILTESGAQLRPGRGPSLHRVSFGTIRMLENRCAAHRIAYTYCIHNFTSEYIIESIKLVWLTSHDAICRVIRLVGAI